VSIFVTGGSGFVGGALIDRLVADGEEVWALARSPRAVHIVAARGARPVKGSLDDVDPLRAGMRGASLVVHAAACLTAGPRERREMSATNVAGTQQVLDAAIVTGVPTLVHVSTEQVVLGRHPLVRANESWPRPQRHASWYGSTKADAESIVLAASDLDIRAVAVRPRFVWGRGDPTLLPQIVEATRTGTFRWIGGGDYLTSTCHVDNVVEGILCAAKRGAPGTAYFLTDGPPQQFRTFVESLLTTSGVPPPTKSVPRAIALAVGAGVELGWGLTRRRGPAPLERATLAVIGQECTVDDSRARAEIGYRPKVTVEQGLASLRSP